MNEDCPKLVTYFGERQRINGRFLAVAILDLFGQHEIAASIMLRGIGGGFGLDITSARIYSKTPRWS